MDDGLQNMSFYVIHPIHNMLCNIIFVLNIFAHILFLFFLLFFLFFFFSFSYQIVFVNAFLMFAINKLYRVNFSLVNECFIRKNIFFLIFLLDWWGRTFSTGFGRWSDRWILKDSFYRTSTWKSPTKKCLNNPIIVSSHQHISISIVLWPSARKFLKRKHKKNLFLYVQIFLLRLRYWIAKSFLNFYGIFRQLLNI